MFIYIRCPNQEQSYLHADIPGSPCGSLHVTNISELLSILVKIFHFKVWGRDQGNALSQCQMHLVRKAPFEGEM